MINNVVIQKRSEAMHEILTALITEIERERLDLQAEADECANEGNMLEAVSMMAGADAMGRIERAMRCVRRGAIAIETEGGDAKQAPSRSDESAAIAQPIATPLGDVS